MRLTKTNAMVLVIAIVGALGIGITTNVLGVFAQGTPQNGFGKASSSFAIDPQCAHGSLGAHVSSFAGEHQSGGQSGIGNLAQAGRGGIGVSACFAMGIKYSTSSSLISLFSNSYLARRVRINLGQV
jgi:hypothetical protein